MQTYTIKVSPKTPQVTLLRFVSPDNKSIRERELNQAEVEQFAAEVEAAYKINEPNLPALGRRLFEWLDGAEHRWLASAMEESGALTLRIDVEGRLRHLPWELLFADGAYLCFNAVRPFTPARLVASKPRAAQTHNRPLRLLFMACSAEDVQPLLDFEHEESLILDAVQQHQIELFVEESGSLGGLNYQTTVFGAGHFDVFHLTGHADVRGNEPIFLMENDQGFRQEVTAADISDAFAGNWPQLMFLSGCKTGQAADQGHLPSLCEALVRAGAPAVLGWALPVGDLAASRAAAELYELLAAGKHLDEAVARARFYLLKHGSPFWHLLRLYVGDKSFSPLVTPPKTPKRARLHNRLAESDFLDAGSKVEVCKRKDFIGRRRVIQRCLSGLQSRSGDEAYAEGVLLHGMGGLGKSSLAARLCERLQPQGYERIVVVGALQHEDWDFLSRVKDKLADVEVNQLLDEPRLPLHQRLRKLFEGPLAEQSFLFVFDDFEQNMEPSGDRWIVKAEPLRILTALLTAIHQSASESRAIVTCRYEFSPAAPLKLHEESLESLRGAELKKKLSRLAAWQIYSPEDEANKRRAEELSAGNPRLLEWLNRVLMDAALDQEAILTAMEQQVETFRENTLLSRLLQQLSPECRRMIALASVYALPFDRQAIAAAADAPLDPHLSRAVSLGLIEEGIIPATGEARYFVSRVLLPLMNSELTAEEFIAAFRRAAHHLYQTLWHPGSGVGFEESLEIFRLAMAAQEREIAAEIADRVAASWVNGARYREAEQLCETALSLGEDYRLLHQLARAQVVLGKTTEASRDFERALFLCPTDNLSERNPIIYDLAYLVAQQGEINRALHLWQQSLEVCDQIGETQGKAATLHQMAGVIAQQGDVKRALDLWQQSLQLYEQIGDVKGKAATLHEMAGVIAQQGDVKRALDFWQQSLQLYEQIGDVKGKAATLHEMAGVIAQQGDVKRALDLWQQSLQLLEQIGDVKGKAATLANMAWAAGLQGDFEEERRLNLEAAKSLAAVQAWLDVVTVLGNLGLRDADDALGFLAQANWLTIHVWVPAEDALAMATAMMERLGTEHKAAPLLATTAMFLLKTRGEDHPEQEKLRSYATNVFFACAEARGIEPEQVEAWMQAEGLHDPNRFLPALDRMLEAMVGEDGWLFDRETVGR